MIVLYCIIYCVYNVHMVVNNSIIEQLCSIKSQRTGSSSTRLAYRLTVRPVVCMLPVCCLALNLLGDGDVAGADHPDEGVVAAVAVDKVVVLTALLGVSYIKSVEFSGKYCSVYHNNVNTYIPSKNM